MIEEVERDLKCGFWQINEGIIASLIWANKHHSITHVNA